MLSPSSIQNFPSQKTDLSKIQLKPDFDNSIDSSEYNFNKREFKEEDIKRAPVLILEDEEGDILQQKKLELNASGLIGANRKMKDGVTFFGTQIKIEDKVVNDFLLNIDYANVKEIGAYVFIIYYKKEQNKYFLRACKDKSNTKNTMLLVKITDEYVF